MKETAFFGSDVDESRLHTRQHCLDFAEVDVTYCSVDLRTIDQ